MPGSCRLLSQAAAFQHTGEGSLALRTGTTRAVPGSACPPRREAWGPPAAAC